MKKDGSNDDGCESDNGDTVTKYSQRECWCKQPSHLLDVVHGRTLV